MWFVRDDAGVGRNRAGTGLALALFLVALASVPGGLSIATAVLVGVAILIVVGTFAPVIPGVRRLPLIGGRSAEPTTQGGTGTQGIDKRIDLNEHRRRGAELTAAPPNEALAQEWSDKVVKYLKEEGWPFPGVVERFQNAGTGTAADRLRPRVDVLGEFIARLGSADESGSAPSA
jgi:hypothetical protein